MPNLIVEYYSLSCWSEMWRFQLFKRESRDPTRSVANEETRPRPQKASHVTEISSIIHSFKSHELNVHVTFLCTLVFQQNQ